MADLASGDLVLSGKNQAARVLVKQVQILRVWWELDCGGVITS